MPLKAKFSKEEILAAAIDLVRQKGIEALTARALGVKLGVSSSPIFTIFQSMNEVKQGVIEEANVLHQTYVQGSMESQKYPPYKASGMAYIQFAQEEKELFKLLFMRDRSHEKIDKNSEEVEPFIQLIQKNMGLNEQDAYKFHLEMWIYVHGIATMIATSYLEWDMEFVSQVLTDGYTSLKDYYGKEMNDESN